MIINEVTAVHTIIQYMWRLSKQWAKASCSRKTRAASAAENVKHLAPNSERATQRGVSTSVNAESASELRNIRERCNLGWFCCTSPSWRNWLASSPLEMVTSFLINGCFVKRVALCWDRFSFPRVVGVFGRQSALCFVGCKKQMLIYARAV